MNDMTNNLDFDDIRFHSKAEVPEVVKHLLDNKKFINLLSTLFPLMPKDVLRKQISNIQSIDDVQKHFAYPLLKDLEANKTKGVDFRGIETIDRNKPYLYISNHRDIIIDSAFLCFLMIEQQMNTVAIGIGDNLLIYPWIKDLVRLNKAFIVKRGLNARQALEASQKLSAYMRHLIKNDNQSIWIAQREGRSKDSNDRTQEGLLKMLAFSSEKTFGENMSELNICPLTISYEYDPTDYLKAKEFQQRRDNPDHQKSPQDDLDNMGVGLLGYRGKVDYRISGDMNSEICEIAGKTKVAREQIGLLAQAIDRKIHSNYSIFNINKIAYDLLKQEKRFASDYSDSERFDFEHYISKQIAKIEIDNKDSIFLREKMLEMYANPLINHLAENIV